MTTHREPVPVRTVGRPPRRWYVRVSTAVPGTLGYGALMLPVAVAALPLCLLGRARTVRSWWSALAARLLRRPQPPADAPTPTGTALGHGLVSVLVGAVCWVLLGIVALVVARGALFGLVVDGPYTTSWGGPTRTGAWLAHFLIGLPFAVAATVLLRLVADLHVRLGAGLRGERAAPWVVPVCLVLAALGAALVVAWTRQI
ncbi:MAG: hypothetical protein WCA46_15130 [Actinocatenispora sp.]